MNKKYELVNCNEFTGLWRIRALRSFGGVKAGDLGGWIKKESNLSHDGNCWIYGNAMIFDNAEVYGDAKVYGDANIYGNATVCGNAKVYGDAKVHGNAMIFENADVYDNAKVYDNARVYDNAKVIENANVYGDAKVGGKAMIYGKALVYGNAEVYGNAMIYSKAWVYGDASVYGNAKIGGNAKVCGNAVVAEEHRICYLRLDCDITDGKNKIQSIQCQTNLGIINNEVYCYKVVCDDLTSLYDHTFQYKVGEWAKEPNYNRDPTVSCSGGLHFSHLSYWEINYCDNKIIYCKVPLEDVIAVQEGKIRAKRAFVIGVCDNKVY